LRYRWSTPLALIGIALVFIICREVLLWDAVTCQIVTMTSALVVMSGLWAWVYFQARRQEKKQESLPDLPPAAAVTYLLTPYFLYGLAYFGLLFADRFAAGWVLEKYSSISFAMDTRYQRPMDLALLNFLILIPFVEYFGDKFCHWWYKQTKISTPQSLNQCAQKLQRRYWIFSQALLGLGLLVGLVTVGLMAFAQQSTNAISLTVFGLVGYGVLAVGLWNAIILLVLDRIVVVLKLLFPAVAIDLICGYIFGNLWGVSWVPIGLLLGSLFFVAMASRQVLSAIRQPDYCYFYSGY
jgi:hypothetical protein